MDSDPAGHYYGSSALARMSWEWGRYVEGQSSGGLLGRGYSLFKQGFEYELADSVSKGINQLLKDWAFLTMLMKAILNYSDAAELLRQSGKDSVVQKINACGHEMSEYLEARHCGKKYIFNRPKKFSILLSHCRTMTDALLKEEVIGASALEHISSLVFKAKPPYDLFDSSCFDVVFRNLESIMDDGEDGSLGKHLRMICDELKLIHKYLFEVKHWNLNSKVVENHAFTAHVMSVIVRIAIQSCNFWFNRKDVNIAIGFVNLQHQIDPSNPEFMKLILELQQVLSDEKCEKPSECVKSGAYFCRYILPSCSNKDIEELLMSLSTIFYTTTLRSHSYYEDVHCFFAEAIDLFAEAAWLHRQENETDDLHSCSYLLPKICILETEFFLKEQIIMRNPVPFCEVQIVKVEEILKHLSGATIDICQRRIADCGKQKLLLAQEFNSEVLSLYKSVQSNKMTDSMIKQLILQLLFKIVFFKAESFLTELSISQTGKTFIDNGKEQIEPFIMELKYLKHVACNHLVWNLRDEEMLLFTQVEAVVRRASFLSYSFPPNVDKFVLSLPNLLNKAKDIKAKLQEISSPITLSSFPKNFELGFIDFLARNIREVLKCDTELISPIYNLLKRTQTYLEEFISIFVEVDSDILRRELNGIRTHFMELAYKLECVVESIEVDGRLEHSLRLYDLLEDIRLVNEQVFSISSRAAELNYPCASDVSCKKILRDTTQAMHVDLVDEEKAITDLLMRGSSGRDVVSIVGMPGIGKTTLAGKVYNDKNIVCHFPRRAWCNVSQVYSKRDLLLDLLSGIHGDSNKFHGMSDDTLLSKLRRCLLGSRYLIVLDDVWDAEAWDEIQISLPNDGNGSRILITSRLRDVHSTINPGSDPHFIRSFSDEESWMLLEKKIFQGGYCPGELMLLGKKIAEHCQGLPLAVVALAGLLPKKEKTQDWWEKISNSISLQLMTDPSPENRCKEILELSYKHLPEYLKPCFLYMGIFLRDKEIPVSKLLQFWLAEGFLQEKESKSLEVVAHDYLMELINRSLVILSKTRSDGGVKTCRLHDLLRDLCHSKARDDNFLHLVTKDDEPYASFPDSDYDMQFRSPELDPVTFNSYRSSIFLRRNHFIDSKPSGPRTRSLIFFASADKEPRCPYEISFIFNNFKLLRVLHLECINMGVSFPAEIGLMIQLRYLALSGYMQSVPPSIANLWKLQTLVVRGFRGSVKLPSTVWGMSSLRHLHVNEHVILKDDEGGDSGGSSCLDNLVSFCTPSFSRGDKTVNMLRRFPNLLKMRCIFLESRESCNEFPVLDILSQLESLNIMYHGRAVDSGEFVLPLSLKKLTLSNFRLPWKHVSRIGELPNLKVLKLLSGAFNGQIWEMNEGEFQELEFLKLEALDIAEWIATEDHLPSLKRLVVKNCKKLEEIPQDFAGISTLEVIEVQWCTKAVEESAERIGDLTEEIKVDVAYN